VDFASSNTCTMTSWKYTHDTSTRRKAATGVICDHLAAPTPDMWHISTSKDAATEEPVPTDHVEALLAA
jgi:hypothetical protein